MKEKTINKDHLYYFENKNKKNILFYANKLKYI